MNSILALLIEKNSADVEALVAIFGVPAIRFARTVQRDDAAVVKRVTL